MEGQDANRICASKLLKRKRRKKIHLRASQIPHQNNATTRRIREAARCAEKRPPLNYPIALGGVVAMARVPCWRPGRGRSASSWSRTPRAGRRRAAASASPPKRRRRRRRPPLAAAAAGLPRRGGGASRTMWMRRRGRRGRGGHAHGCRHRHCGEARARARVTGSLRGWPRAGWRRREEIKEVRPVVSGQIV